MSATGQKQQQKQQKLYLLARHNPFKNMPRDVQHPALVAVQQFVLI